MSTLVYPFRKAVATNATSSSFTAKIPTATEPTGTGVFNLFDRDMGLAINTRTPDSIQIVPFGANDDNDVFNLRLWGWNKIYSPTTGLTSATVWVPQLILDLACTLGNISAAAITASNFLCDTIAVTKGPAAGPWRDLITTTTDTAASIITHTRGSEKIEFDFDLDTNCDSMNALWRLLDFGS